MVALTQDYLFELCATKVDAARAAQAAGAHRIELCVNLDVGGLTPPLRMIEATLSAVTIPVRILIRPRAGNFNYTSAEFARMRREVLLARDFGAEGVALGVLLPSNEIDVDRTRELVELARPMRVTFHRAFDHTPDIAIALEAVISTGADCLLTSGGAVDVETGAASIEELVRQAAGRIGIMAGGGLRLNNLRGLLQETGVRMVHGSLGCQSDALGEPLNADSHAEWQMNLEANIRHTVRVLHEERNRCMDR